MHLWGQAERFGDHVDRKFSHYRNVSRGFQYSLSYCASSGEISEPYVLVVGVVEGAQMIIIPSAESFRPTKRSFLTHVPSPDEAMSSPDETS